MYVYDRVVEICLGGDRGQHAHTVSVASGSKTSSWRTLSTARDVSNESFPVPTTRVTRCHMLVTACSGEGAQPRSASVDERRYSRHRCNDCLRHGHQPFGGACVGVTVRDSASLLGAIWESRVNDTAELIEDREFMCILLPSRWVPLRDIAESFSNYVGARWSAMMCATL